MPWFGWDTAKSKACNKESTIQEQRLFGAKRSLGPIYPGINGRQPRETGYKGIQHETGETQRRINRK